MLDAGGWRLVAGSRSTAKELSSGARLIFSKGRCGLRCPSLPPLGPTHLWNPGVRSCQVPSLR